MEDCFKEIDELKSKIEKQQVELEKHAEEKKEFRYKLAGLAEEMKNQKIRLDREADKSKVSYPTLARQFFIKRAQTKRAHRLEFLTTYKLDISVFSKL